MRWELDPDRLAAEWFDNQANESFPLPLTYLSRCTHQDEWAAFRARVASEHIGQEFHELRANLAMLAKPQARVEVIGLAGNRHDVAVRALGCVQSDRAVLAAQRPTGNIVIWALPAVSLPGRLAGILPDVKPGRRKGGRFTRDELNAPEQPSFLLSAQQRQTPREQYREIVHAPRELTVSIRSFAGPRYVAPDNVGGFQLFDVRGDGRYLRYGTGQIIVRPVAETDVKTKITAILGQARDQSDLA